ncbi:MAG TPA: hypothetical protein DIT16_00105 [Clostridium sp.]|nr:hypothetical protein [Clostridium sp.]
MEGYCRVLNTDLQVECFVDGVLKIHDTTEKREAINIITAAERNMKDYNKLSTYLHQDNRDFEYRDEKIRKGLRKIILEELINLERLDNDDEIKLGKGGAKPKTELKCDKKAFYIIGPPASGKSTIANKIADKFGAYILDSDYVKRKLPEYKNQIGSASLVHEESDAIISRGKDLNLLDHCVKNGYNITIPKIGHRIDGICNYCEAINNAGYEVFIISVDLDRVKATQRAYYRFKETQRYIPLALVFDGYGNQPTLNYFKLRQNKLPFLKGYAQISTDVEKGELPILLEEENLYELVNLFGGDING